MTSQLQPDTTPRGRRVQVWSQDHSARAAEMWQQHFGDAYGDDDPFLPHLTRVRYRVVHEIAKALDRTYSSVEYRLQTYGISFGTNQASRAISPHALADRDARKEAENFKSITAQLFGDPPPGFSALDRKKNLNHRTTAVLSTAERSS